MAQFVERKGKIQVRIRKGKYKYNPITKTFAKKTAAKAWATKVEDEIERGVFVDGRNARGILVNEMVDRYIKEVTAEKSDRTIKSEATRFERWKGLLANITLDRADADLLFNEMKGLLTTEKQYSNADNPQYFSKAYVRKHCQDLVNVFNMAQHVWNYPLPHGNAAHDAVQKMRFSNQLANYDYERDTRIEPEDYDRIRTHQSPKQGTLFKFVALFAIESGMRRGEIMAMTWDRVHFKRRFYDLENQKSDKSRKRKRTGREVPLSRRAIAILRLVRMVRRNSPKRVGFVWPWADGDTVYRGVTRIYEKLGIENVTFHDLRHEFGGYAVESGLHERVVGQMLGHADPKSTKRYTRARANRLADMLDEKRR